MKCAHCAHLDTTARHASDADMQKLGFWRCDGFGLHGHYVAMTRDMECDRFSQASEAVIESRRQEWAKRKSNKGDK